jgi:AcrR family transcriptional regulator
VKGVAGVVGDPEVLDSLRDRDGRDERGRLMEAALYVMRQNGFQGASVQGILDRAGLSTRAFYRQFRSKDDLLLAMFRTASIPDVARVERSVAETPAPLDAVCAWIDEMVAMAFDAKRIRRLVIFNAVARQAHGFEDEEESLRTRLIAPLSEVVRRGRDDGSFPTAEPVTDANTIYDLVWSVAHPLRRSPSSGRAEAVSQVLRFCLPALGVAVEVDPDTLAGSA